MMIRLLKVLIGCLLGLSYVQVGWSKSVEITTSNIDEILRSNELVMVNFYANWCRFSQMLVPIYNEAAEKIQQEFPETGKVVLGAVDCDREGTVAARYGVNKYPTLKIFRYGSLVRKEYRGQRSVDALMTFVREQLRSTIQTVQQADDLDNLDHRKRHIIGHFDNEQSADYTVFKTVASMFREECQFHALFGSSSPNSATAQNRLFFRPAGVGGTDIVFAGSLYNQNLVVQWTTDKCVPLVREITFENAEELTEEGLPFVILFHDPIDTRTVEKYRQVVSKDLYTEKNSVNFLTADGHKFAHPLAHLGKSANDLPLIVIDSFRHMYLWPNDPRKDLENSQLLKTFVADLNSGKLHREFHNGPDPVQQAPEVHGDSGGHVAKDADTDEVKKPAGDLTAPPPSVFKKLGPSHNRYTILRDEL